VLGDHADQDRGEQDVERHGAGHVEPGHLEQHGEDEHAAQAGAQGDAAQTRDAAERCGHLRGDGPQGETGTQGGGDGHHRHHRRQEDDVHGQTIPSCSSAWSRVQPRRATSV
jgi:hypothetical protein